MLQVGIVGLPNVGKSTLFSALTKKQVDISNYPFTTINPNVGVVAVPDERIELLAKMSNSKKQVSTAIEFFDIAGLVKGAAQGEGLGNKFLANIREVDAIAEVVRVFENESITHVHKKIDPIVDIGAINTELILADLETVNRHTEKIRRNDPKTVIETSAVDKLKNGLQAGKLAIEVTLDNKEKVIARELNLLTNKKIIYVFNVSEKQLEEKWSPASLLFYHDRGKIIVDKNSNIGSDYVVLSTPFELTLSEATLEDQQIYLQELDLKESGLDTLIKKGYQTLELVTFLTTGEDETRAWTTRRGTYAPQAARAIHTDFERLFIRAEVINWQELLQAGSYAYARQIGKLRTVGRDYIVQDGDVIEIKI